MPLRDRRRWLAGLLVAEIREVSSFGALFAAVVLLWFALGWDPSLSVGGEDAIQSFTPFTAELVRARGDWREVAYRADVTGGVVLLPILCPFPVTRLLAAAGIPLLGVLAATFFALQALAGYLGMKAVLDLSCVWRAISGHAGEGEEDSVPARARELGVGLLVGLSFAFAPVIAWRIAHGHPGLIAGTFVFSGALMLGVAGMARRTTVTSTVLAVVAFMHAFESTSAQTALYSVVFGGPLIAGILLSCPADGTRAGRLRLTFSCAAPIVLGVAALLVSWDVFAAIYQSATSDDSPRARAGAAVYSHVVAAPRDWLLSLPWSYGIVDPARPPHLHHETNFPVGPPLLLMALAPWRKGGRRFAGWLLGTLAVSFLLVVAFASDIRPISSAILGIVPPLHYFRVPARAATPLCLAVATLGLAALVSRPRERIARPLALVAVAAPIAFVLAPTWSVELAAALGILALAVESRTPWVASQRAWLNPAAVTLVVTVASLVAFRERLLPFENLAGLTEDAARLSRAIRGRLPEENPLRRSACAFVLGGFGGNTGTAVGASTLDGYANPTARFLALKGALEGRPPEHLAVFVHIGVERPDFPIWRALYNVTHVIGVDRGRVRVLETGQSDRPAWFSASVDPVPDEARLAAELRDAPDLSAALASKAWYVASDLRTTAAAAVPSVRSEGCARAKVLAVRARGQRFTIDVDLPDRCVLTLATNYTSLFRAHAWRGGSQEGAPLFPVYGALTGVLVPAGASRVEVEARVETSSAAAWALALGLSLLLVTLAGGLALQADATGRRDPPRPGMG